MATEIKVPTLGESVGMAAGIGTAEAATAYVEAQQEAERVAAEAADRQALEEAVPIRLSTVWWYFGLIAVVVFAAVLRAILRARRTSTRGASPSPRGLQDSP